MKNLVPILDAYQVWVTSDRVQRFGQYIYNRGLISKELSDKHNLFYETDAPTVLARVIEELEQTDE